MSSGVVGVEGCTGHPCDALRSGGDLDFMREAMQLVLQALIDLEATEKIGAARDERTDACVPALVE